MRAMGRSVLWVVALVAVGVGAPERAWGFAGIGVNADILGTSNYRLAPVSSHICGFVGLGGQLGSDYGRPYVRLTRESDGYYHLRGKSTAGVVYANVTCYPLNRFAGFQPGSLSINGKAATMNKESWATDQLWPVEYLTIFHGFDQAFDGRGESAKIGPRSDGYFWVQSKGAGYAAQLGGTAYGTSYFWGSPPGSGSYRAGRFILSQDNSAPRPYSKTISLIGRDEGVCFIAGISGKFRGQGERVDLDDWITWSFTIESQQSDISAMVECFYFNP